MKKCTNNITFDIQNEPYTTDNIKIPFEINTTEEITDCNLSLNGLELLDPLTYSNNVGSFKIKPLSQKGSLFLSFSTNCNTTISKELYVLKTESGTYLSNNSIEDCEAVSSTLFNISNFFKAGIKNEYTSFETNNTNIIQPSKSIMLLTQTIIEGQLLWEENSAKAHPLVGTYVCIKEKNGYTDLFSTFTDEEGKYSFKLSNNDFKKIQNKNILICAKTKTEKAKVFHPLITLQEYVAESSPLFLTTTGQRITKSFTITNGQFAGNAFQICQPIYWGFKYVNDMDAEVTLPHIDILYPSQKSCADGFFNSIHLVKDDYCDWDVILHELGHIIQSKLGISNSNGGSHSGNEDLTIRYSKDYGLRLGWAESWPTVFGILVTKYYGNLLPDIQNIKDDYYDDILDAYIHDNLETPTSRMLELGETCENVICCVLFDLFDDYSVNEPFDKISLGHQTFWNLIKSSKAKTLFEFISYLYAHSTLNTNSINLILEECRVTVTNINITYNSLGLPTLHWSPSGNVKNNNTNLISNKYFIHFYDSFSQYLFSTNQILSNAEYELLDSQWEKILKSAGESFYVKIESYSTQSAPIIGPYFSPLKAFSKSSAFNDYIYLCASSFDTFAYPQTKKGSIEEESFALSYEAKGISHQNNANEILADPTWTNCESYICFTSTTPISGFGVNLCCLFSSSNSKQVCINIDYLNSKNQYVSFRVIDINDLQAPYKYTYYYFDLPYPVNGVRIRFIQKHSIEAYIFFIEKFVFNTKYQFILNPIDHQYD